MGSVIQGTGMVEFEDGLWIGNHLKAQNGLQRVRTIPRAGAMRTPWFLRGQNEFKFAWVCAAAWCQARHGVQFPAAAMIGLTLPGEEGMFVLIPEVRQNS